MPTPIFFRSGLCRANDFEASVLAGVPAGISIQDCSAPFLRLLRLHLGSGSWVFADSGAFGAYRSGKPLTDSDFRSVLAHYAHLAAHSVPGRLYVVAPDVVGDQAASAELLERFAPQLQSLIFQGAIVLIPLQKGARPISEAWNRAVEILGETGLCAALPSNAAALPSDEALAFLRSANPQRIHFLGAARNERFQLLLQEAQSIAPECKFSYDAAVVRSFCDKLPKPTRTSIRSLAIDGPDADSIDDTESFSALLNGDRCALEAARRLCSFGGSVDDFATVLASASLEHDDDLGAALDTLSGGLFLGSPLFDSYFRHVTVEFRFRTFSIAACKEFRDEPHEAQRTELLLVA